MHPCARRRIERMAAFDAIVEPLVQHHVAQPAFAELPRDAGAHVLEAGMRDPASALARFGEPRVVIDAQLEIGVGDGACLILEE